MQRRTMSWATKPWLWLALLLLVASGTAQAQFTDFGNPLTGSTVSEHPVKVQAHFAPDGENGQAVLYVTAEMRPGWHVYSLTQAKGGPLKSEIKLEPSSNYSLEGEFLPDPPAEKHEEPVWDGLIVETHEKEVTWFVPIKLNAAPADVTIKGTLTVQACDPNSCLPPKKLAFEAKLGEPVELSEAARSAISHTGVPAPIGGLPPTLEETPADFRADGSHVIWRGQILPDVAMPGEEVLVHLTAEPVEDFHLYGYEPKDPRTPGASKPTLVLLTEHPGLTVDGPVASEEPGDHVDLVNPTKIEKYYEKPVAWTFRMKIPADAKPGKIPVAGMVAFMACRSGEGGVCDIPKGAKFTGEVQVGETNGGGATPLQFTLAKSYTEVSKLADAAGDKAVNPPATMESTGPPPAATEAENPASLSILSAIGFGFLGGFILNFMPCVLPVIGLKLLSFVEQAGKERGHIFALNAVYSFGILSVFLVLAGLLTVFQFGWGQQFSFASFNIVMTCVIFVMALSFLGVWEIPIPGFVGGSKANALARREGWSGTFTKGVLTTLLATPCSGPGLGTALAWCADKPAVQVYAVFTSMGLGMASPYLVIGAFPALIRFLPKPGAWMDTFKHVMGFVLIATVAYMLTLLRSAYVVPTVTLLFGLWAACWWIGRLPYTATSGEKVKTWVQAIALSAAIFVVAFIGWERWTPEQISFAGLKHLMEEREDELFRQKLAMGGSLEVHVVENENEAIPWNPYSDKTLAQLTADSRPVMIDFTAVWCQTCHFLERTVLNTTPVRAKLKELEVVPLQADMSEWLEEPAKLLSEYGTQQIPVVAIYPAGSTKPSKVFLGQFTQAALIAALEEAEKLKQPPSETRTALVNP